MPGDISDRKPTYSRRSRLLREYVGRFRAWYNSRSTMPPGNQYVAHQMCSVSLGERSRHTSSLRSTIIMLHFVRRSLLSQLLSMYLLFVAVVLIGGVVVNAVVEQQLTRNVESSDEALAQEIATQTSLQLTDAEAAVQNLGSVVLTAPSPKAVETIFDAFQRGRSDVKQVYWLDPYGSILI